MERREKERQGSRVGSEYLFTALYGSSSGVLINLPPLTAARDQNNLMNTQRGGGPYLSHGHMMQKWMTSVAGMGCSHHDSAGMRSAAASA
jgi:hypothetical protein